MHLAKRTAIIAASLTAASVGAWAARPTLEELGSFDHVDLHLEADMATFAGELSLKAESSLGIVQLSLADASGKNVLQMSGHDFGETGAASVSVESRTVDVRAVFKCFPVGTYTVTGVAADGSQLRKEIWLSHTMPSRFRLHTPQQGEVVPVDDLFMRWDASSGAKRYHLELEGATGELALEIWLPAEETSFLVPRQLLTAGATYEYSLNSEGVSGNELEVEGSFSTEPRSTTTRAQSVELDSVVGTR